MTARRVITDALLGITVLAALVGAQWLGSAWTGAGR